MLKIKKLYFKSKKTDTTKNKVNKRNNERLEISITIFSFIILDLIVDEYITEANTVVSEIISMYFEILLSSR